MASSSVAVPVPVPVKGTTIAFVHGDSVIVAECSPSGGCISSQTPVKIFEINTHMVGAGWVGSRPVWDKFRTQCRREYGSDKISMDAALDLLVKLLRPYCGLNVRTMIAGWDNKEGPSLYTVNSEGGKFKAKLGDRFSFGYRLVDACHVFASGYHHDMTIPDAYELAKRAIYTATIRDCDNDSVVTVCHVGPFGCRQVSCDDVGRLYERYRPVELATGSYANNVPAMDAMNTLEGESRDGDGDSHADDYLYMCYD